MANLGVRLKLNILKPTCDSGRGILKLKFNQVSRGTTKTLVKEKTR